MRGVVQLPSIDWFGGCVQLQLIVSPGWCCFVTFEWLSRLFDVV